ncbi:MAG: LysR family transcriptional regulator [Eubacterium sp.]|nr:LysR family transcriptional regulator [Eubacterium sp.]
MNTSQMKLFLTAAQHLNFTKAADQLEISQPTLSRQISNIESELNLMLFIRNGRELKLTPAGRALADTLSQVYHNYQNAVSQAQQIQRGLNGELRIGILHGTYVSDFMPEIVQYFQEKYSYVEISFIYDSFQSLQNKLYDNTLDISFTTQFNVINKEYLLYTYVEHTHDNLLMNRFHPLARRKNLSLADCKNETFILISEEDCPESSRLIIDACREQGFYPKISFAPTLYDLMLNTEAGKGITILDTRNMLRLDPHIKSFPLLNMKWDPSLVAVWNQNNFNPAIPVFMARLNQFSKNRPLL